MRLILKLATALILFPFTLLAHGFWIETEGSHRSNEAVIVKLYFGDYEAGERLSGKALIK